MIWCHNNLTEQSSLTIMSWGASKMKNGSNSPSLKSPSDGVK